MTPERILVVGGHGYIGRHLVPVLSRWTPVLVPTRAELELGRPASYSYLGANPADTVVILAATIGGLDPGAEAPSSLLENNVHALEDFLNTLRSRSPRVLYFSSMAVYGAHRGEARESDATSPINPYGISKVRAEECLRAYGRSVILRVPGVFGGDRRGGLLYHVREKARANMAITVRTDGLPAWEAIEVEDLCRQTSEFLQNYDWASSWEVFNVGYGHETDLIQTVEHAVRMLESTSPIVVESRHYAPFHQSTAKISPYLRSRFDFGASLRRYLGAP